MKINKIYFLFIFCASFFPCTNFMAVAQTPDPGLPGSYAVTKAEYNLGDTAFLPAGFPYKVEARGSVHYPTDLSAGPFPVLIFLHGRHSTCYDTTNPSNTALYWPCDAYGPTYAPITSYEGYDYLANTMASHGYIVISISANCINAFDDYTSDLGMSARAELMQFHLDLWKRYNTIGGLPFDSLFIGKLDLNNVGTMGHSRGGEGVIWNAQLNRSLGSPYGIKAVLTLAPVDFYGHVLNGTALMNVAPYCDGDVSNLAGVHFYDDARYADTTDETPKHSVLFMGANHDFFNTVWTPGSYIAGGADDWAGYGYDASDPQCGTTMPTRFDSTKQKAALNTYAAAFYRLYIGNETAFAPILNVDDIVPPASSTLDSADVYVSYHPGRSNRLDINRTDNLTTEAINTLADTVRESGLVYFGICNDFCGVTSSGNQMPHYGLSQMALQWNDTAAWYENELPPAYQNISSYRDLQFRASVNFATSPAGKDLNFTVQLIDSTDNVSAQAVNEYSHALFYQPGAQPGDLPKLLFNTIKITLSDFGGVDLTKVRKVKFLFNKSTAGSIFITDLALSGMSCRGFNTVFHHSIDTGYEVAFTNETIVSGGDSLLWKWNFGDELSGVSDTSTLKNPNHTYSSPGFYTTCLYGTLYQKSGFTCVDTFCANVLLVPPVTTETPEQNKSSITIGPNPATDYLHISGADNTNVFTLVNLYGQTVLETNVTNATIYLPQNLASGIYYAIITTNTGKVYKKIFIGR